MRDFFALDVVKAAIEVQKTNPFGSEPHRRASEAIFELAEKYGARSYFPKEY